MLERKKPLPLTSCMPYTTCSPITADLCLSSCGPGCPPGTAGSRPHEGPGAAAVPASSRLGCRRPQVPVGYRVASCWVLDP